MEWFRIPTDRGWTRDCAPIFLCKTERPRETAIIQFHFNAWARYPNWKKDNAVAQRAAKASGCRLLPAEFDNQEFVLEGGSIDVNGNGPP